MFIATLRTTAFKPFSDLQVTLENRPRLVVACGMNGTGKSSLIDALGYWRRQQHFGISDPPYYSKNGLARSPSGSVEIEFHGGQPADRRAAVYVRTAQRVTVEFNIANVGALEYPLAESGPARTIDLDTRVEQNYRRLLGESVSALWDRSAPSRTSEEIVEGLVGAIRDPLARLLPGFVFEGLGDNPLENGTFAFSKGSSQRYPYKLLSGGEKAVFDLLLDFAVKRVAYNDTVYCLDEPELHVNAKIHRPLLDEVLALIPRDCQLVIATHSPGMLSQARAIEHLQPGSVAFLDFDGRDFDQPVHITPATPDRAFWRRQLEIAFGEFANLLAPSRIVLCEGEASALDTSRASFDARCYYTIFGAEMPDTSFMAAGNAHDVESDRLQLAERLTTLVDGVELVRLIDRDSMSDVEIVAMREKGVRVLRRRNLECYLLDDEVLAALCAEKGHSELARDLIAARDEAMKRQTEAGAPPDDLKRVRGETVTTARRLLSIPQGGSTADVFLRDTLAPLLTAGTRAYQELREDLFGAPSHGGASD